MTPEKRNPTVVQDPPAIDDDDLREPTKEEIMEDIRQGLRDMKAGFIGQDAMEFLEELEREAMADADSS